MGQETMVVQLSRHTIKSTSAQTFENAEYVEISRRGCSKEVTHAGKGSDAPLPSALLSAQECTPPLPTKHWGMDL